MSSCPPAEVKEHLAFCLTLGPPAGNGDPFSLRSVLQLAGCAWPVFPDTCAGATASMPTVIGTQVPTGSAGPGGSNISWEGATFIFEEVVAISIFKHT